MKATLIWTVKNMMAAGIGANIAAQFEAVANGARMTDYDRSSMFAINCWLDGNSASLSLILTDEAYAELLNFDDVFDMEGW